MTVVSPIRKGTLEPTFDNQFVFYVRNPEDAMVKVQVHLKDLVDHSHLFS